MSQRTETRVKRMLIESAPLHRIGRRAEVAQGYLQLLVSVPNNVDQSIRFVLAMGNSTRGRAPVSEAAHFPTGNVPRMGSGC